ncbi:hypothetical protein AVEN_81426-1 [Araneus ventricosus]|uniref:Uncharacterized protein n=1 Tax=Araneus ventricosus TaxID=182803 RepID=A0A4Y2VBI8_ARAVE|nr:hypothetical protein AVEN_81426-1 [Araneus ventricosus]
MELSASKIQRKGRRTAFSLSSKRAESELSKEVSDLKTLLILRIQLCDKFQRLDNCQNAVSEKLLQTKEGEQLFSDYLEESEDHRHGILELCIKIDSKLQEFAFPNEKENKSLNYLK